MEIISEEEISTSKAIHLLKKVAKNTDIEEYDTELSKYLGLVLNELTTHKKDIYVPETAEEEKEEKVEEAGEEVKAEEAEQPKEEEQHKHRKHRSHKHEE